MLSNCKDIEVAVYVTNVQDSLTICDASVSVHACIHIHRPQRLIDRRLILRDWDCCLIMRAALQRIRNQTRNNRATRMTRTSRARIEPQVGRSMQRAPRQIVSTSRVERRGVSLGFASIGQ